jgi:uncharacterized FlaG/YvyC family protein
MSKIVEFPKHKIVREIPTNEGAVEQAKIKGKINYAENIVEDLVDIIVEELENQGIDVENEFFLRDFSLTVDALRATLYRQFNVEHGLHNFIDENVKIVDKKTGKVIELPKDPTDVDNED